MHRIANAGGRPTSYSGYKGKSWRYQVTHFDSSKLNVLFHATPVRLKGIPELIISGYSLVAYVDFESGSCKYYRTMMLGSPLPLYA